ncbi:MAG: hypothetical protein N2234_05360 [Planctomycetota bacterium]|nr:hypothetical protein [Planctomycetota bacterium]
MNWFERFKAWISGKRLPDETKAALEGSEDSMRLLGELDNLTTRNEMEIGRLNKEIERLEKMEQEQVARLKDESIGERSKRIILRTIQRLRMQMDNLENRIAIYENNLRLHLTLIGRLQQIQAMGLTGVSEEEIDDVLDDFEMALEEYEEKLQAGRLMEMAKRPKETASEDEELLHLEKEILGKTKESDREKEKRRMEKKEKERKTEQAEGE